MNAYMLCLVLVEALVGGLAILEYRFFGGLGCVAEKALLVREFDFGDRNHLTEECNDYTKNHLL